MATVAEKWINKMKNSFGIQRPIGTNVNDLAWVEKLSTDTNYSATGKENGWGVRITWSGPNTPLLMFTTTANKPLPLAPDLETDLKQCFASANIVGTVYCEILGDDSTNHTRNGFAQAQRVMSRVCESSPLTLDTFKQEHLVLVALYDSDRCGMPPTASNRLERLKRLPRIFTDDHGIVTYPEGAHVVCVEIIQENVDQRELVSVITAWLTKCRLRKATPREGMVIRAENSTLTTFGEVEPNAKNYRSSTTWKVKQMCRQKVQILKSSDNGTFVMFKDALGVKHQTIPVMPEMRYRLSAWNRNPGKNPLEAQVLMIHEDVGRESPVRWSILLYLFENRDKQQIDHLWWEQYEELMRKREALALQNGIATGEDVEDEFGIVEGYTLAPRDSTTLIENDRLMAIYAEDDRQLALKEAEQAAAAAAVAEKRALRERVYVCRPWERRNSPGGIPEAYRRPTEYEESEEMRKKEARLRVLDDAWVTSTYKLRSLWHRGLGPRPEWPWGNPPHRGGNPPSDRAETLKKNMAYDKRRDELRSEQDALMEKNRYIFEQQADERVARKHERWIAFFGTTSSQRESARAAVALYDERTNNTHQLREHIHNLNCPLIEANIRQAGKEIDQRLENQRPERELSYREAQAMRDQWDETQRQQNYATYANAKRDESRQRQTQRVAANAQTLQAREGGKTGVDILASPEEQLSSCKTPEKQLSSRKTPEEQLSSCKTPGKQLSSCKTPEEKLSSCKRNIDFNKDSVDSKRGKTVDVRQLVGPDNGGGGGSACDSGGSSVGNSGGSASAARQEKSTSASISMPTVNGQHMSIDSRDLERAAKDIMQSNIRNKLNMTLEEFRRVWLEANKEEKLKLYDSIS